MAEGAALIMQWSSMISRGFESLTLGRMCGFRVYARFQLHLLGSVAELERSIIRERQAEGIAAAKARGGYTRGDHQ